MQLNYKQNGSGDPIVILHGLFGQADNLDPLARSLTSEYQVIQFDLRNHGQSPHHPQHSYPDMANDVLENLSQLNIDCFHLLGHSMGGKVAMQIALTHAKRVKSLIVEDISPIDYPDRHSKIISAMQAVNLEEIKNRQQAAQQLQQTIDPATCQFLLKSLKLIEQKWVWQFNLDALAAQYPQICGFPTHNKEYISPCLFIKGGNSDYITQDNFNSIDNYFPLAKFKIVQGAGHWIHAEKPNVMNKIVLDFLQKQEK